MRFTRTVFLLLGFLAVIGGGLAVVTQPLVQPVPSRPPQVDPQRLEAHVRRLSVDFHPRSHDQSQQLERAAQYILAELQATGGAVSVQEVSVEGNQFKNIVARFGPASGPLHSINAPPMLQGVDFSDHLSYWAEGIPALMITDTSFMRNHHYHQATDTAEKLDYRRMAMVVQGVYAVAQVIR